MKCSSIQFDTLGYYQSFESDDRVADRLDSGLVKTLWSSCINFYAVNGDVGNPRCLLEYYLRAHVSIPNLFVNQFLFLTND